MVANLIVIIGAHLDMLALVIVLIVVVLMVIQKSMFRTEESQTYIRNYTDHID
jgi:hypothetical protein